ncbi:peptidylprolyl isomerase [Tahibacter harae]|uniref:peptidylprolyl isomerase n=1 Tax=Tahibacter harae TaxID=2963937 RepID=A0ABT1QQH9_9GAMM|nr:peptidylprolyl isomerase [Tahibacter harae]MCQ4164529.1 peptidylprolyl isomerase [Tahibacter harae]
MDVFATASALRLPVRLGQLLAAAACAAAAQAHGLPEAPAQPPAATAPSLPLPPLPTTDEDRTVAEIDGERLGSNALALLLRYQRMAQRGADATQLLDEVIEQRLLARHAAARFTRAELFADQRVAFAPEVSAEEKLAGVLRTVYRERLPEELAAEAGADMEKAIIAQPPLTTQQLRDVLGDPARLRVEYALTPEQQQAAATLSVLRYRLPGGVEDSLSLADIYARQNVQGRISLHQLDAAFLAGQAHRRLAELLAVDWAARQAGAAAVAELRRNLLDREYARALAEYYGLSRDIHAASAYQAALRNRIDQAQVGRWYDTHREQFRRLDRVRARHIRLADEAAAARVNAQLHKDGSNFADLARRHSVAPDAAGGGKLGWLARQDKADWFTELVFAQPPGQNGLAVREPAAADAAAHWEIVRVEEQAHGYFPRDSETVRYLAAQTLAEQQARADYEALRRRLRREARVRLAANTVAAKGDRP